MPSPARVNRSFVCRKFIENAISEGKVLCHVTTLENQLVKQVIEKRNDLFETRS